MTDPLPLNRRSAHITQGKARAPQELNSKLPPGLSELIMKTMSVDKSKRFQSMDELRTALERFA